MLLSSPPKLSETFSVTCGQTIRLCTLNVKLAKKSREGNFGNEKGPMVVETSVVLSDFLARSEERGVEREISANFLPG